MLVIFKYVKSLTLTVNISILNSRIATFFHAGLLLGYFIDPEDGGDIFLRNVG
jgi:hypothetical protein